MVRKATGDLEPFSDEKVINSIRRAGIPKQLESHVLSHIKQKLYRNIPTSEVYKHIVEFLGRSSMPYTKARYGLKQAIMDLGPSGYPFEDFVAEILKHQGYTTQTRVTTRGKCISQEIDVIATKHQDNNPSPERVMIEAKFHHGRGTRTDSQVAMYTKARFDDVAESNNLNAVWLVTNTKATTDAITYGLCVGMNVIGWSYPEKGSLRDLVEREDLIPITALTTLSHLEKQTLLDKHVVLCKTICENNEVLSGFNIPPQKRDKILAEVRFICHQA